MASSVTPFNMFWKSVTPLTSEYKLLKCFKRASLTSQMVVNLQFGRLFKLRIRLGPQYPHPTTPTTIVSFILLAIVVALYVYLGHFSYRGTLIHTGALFGTTMAFNVWFRIWPGQQHIIRAVKNGTAPDAATVKLAGLRSRHNTYMSVPLLWGMIGQHTTYFAGGNLGIPSSLYWVFFLIIIIIGWHIVFQCYKKAGKVQGF